MTNDAVVTKLTEHDTAEVAVTRLTACGGNCGNCEACVFDSEVRAIADNPLGAKPGQRVVIESRSAKVFGVVLTVYILPIVLFLAGYLIAFALGASEGLCIAVSFASLALSAALLVISQKRKKDNAITFTIVKIYE